MNKRDDGNAEFESFQDYDAYATANATLTPKVCSSRDGNNFLIYKARAWKTGDQVEGEAHPVHVGSERCWSTERQTWTPK
jgi:hypothetical protein